METMFVMAQKLVPLVREIAALAPEVMKPIALVKILYLFIYFYFFN